MKSRRGAKSRISWPLSELVTTCVVHEEAVLTSRLPKNYTLINRKWIVKNRGFFRK